MSPFSAWLFIRLLAVIYGIAFVSLWVQIEGLVGEDGIAPAARLLGMIPESLGADRYRFFPTLFWLRPEDSTLHLLCGTGTALSLVAAIGLAPAPALAALWLLYLSLLTIGGEFLHYQWDILLLEAGFLAVFLAPLRLRPSAGDEPSPAIVWLFRWLLFRLMFSSGAVKLLSGDPAWRDLTALAYHYETQPLPTWIGWYAHQLPAYFQTISTAVMFAIELSVPLLIFAGASARRVACFAFFVFQLLIAATGNYCFFNLLAIALCVFLLDDGHWPARLRRRFEGGARPSRWPRPVIAVVAALLATLTTSRMLRMVGPVPEPVNVLDRWFAPFRLANSYGLFAVMTHPRHEIVVEGSDDGEQWDEYEFKWKPGDPHGRPGFVAPHQPRLDWQMWFAALSTYDREPWFASFLQKLLEGSDEVLGLLERNPFPGRPPRYVRAVAYRYAFTNPAERRASGEWWRREWIGPYSPVASLRGDLDRGGRARGGARNRRAPRRRIRAEVENGRPQVREGGVPGRYARDTGADRARVSERREARLRRLAQGACAGRQRGGTADRQHEAKRYASAKMPVFVDVMPRRR